MNVIVDIRVDSKMAKAIKLIVLFVLIPISLQIMFGCERGETPSAGNEEESVKEPEQEKQMILPINDLQGSFYTVSGWLKDDTIMYVTEAADGANVFSYNLYEGKSELLFSSNHPIAHVQISPSKKYLLVQSSPYTGLGVVTLLQASGKIIMQSEIEANELSFEWNDQNEEQILITTFTEDWQFKAYELNMTTQKLTEKMLPQPFAHYLNEKEIVFLEWDSDTPALSAPLKKISINELESTPILQNIYQIEVVQNHLLTVSVTQAGNEAIANYRFYQPNLVLQSDLQIPVLTLFSGWLVPYYHLDTNNHLFVTFKSTQSGSIDDYTGRFNLVRYSIEETGEEEALFTDLENEPISCNDQGDLCLYGYQLEKLLRLDTKEQLLNKD